MSENEPKVFSVTSEGMTPSTSITMTDDWFRLRMHDWYRIVVTKPNQMNRLNVFLEHDGDRVWIGDVWVGDMEIPTGQPSKEVVDKVRHVAIECLQEIIHRLSDKDKK